MGYDARRGLIDINWTSSLVFLTKALVGVPLNEQKTPLLVILKRLTTASDFLGGGYDPTEQPSGGSQTRILKLAKLATLLNRSLVKDSALGKSVIEILKEGIKYGSNKKLQVFHLGILHLFTYPNHLLYLLTPEWTWKENVRTGGTYRQLWDQYHGEETMAAGFSFMKSLFQLYRWYRKFLESFPAPGVQAQHRTVNDYFNFLTQNPAGTKLLNEVAVLSLHLQVLARDALKADSSRAPNRRVI